MRIAAAVLFATAFSMAATAATSTYTDFNLKHCKTLMADAQSESVIMRCKGLPGIEVTFAEGDLRGTMAFGPDAKAQCAAHQSFSQFNSPGPRIEWRIDKGKPFATIMRWTTDNGIDGTKHSWLVVTKLEGAKSCRTAIVDGALPEANRLAQERAEHARSFNCEKSEPEIVSRIEIKVAEFLSGSPCGPGPYK